MRKLVLSLTLLLSFFISVYAQQGKHITEEQAIEIAMQEFSGGRAQNWSDIDISTAYFAYDDFFLRMG